MAKLTPSDRFYDQYTALIFEADTCRQWIEELSRRARKNELLSKRNAVVRAEFGAELEELIQCQRALTQAAEALEPIKTLAHNIERTFE